MPRQAGSRSSCQTLALMSLRFVQGCGEPPLHVSAITKDRNWAGAIVFSGRGTVAQAIPFASKSEFIASLQKLISEAVPLSAGGHGLGPADEVGLLISDGILHGVYLDISWASPEHWTVREIGEGTPPWERVADVGLLANVDFNPHSLHRDPHNS